MAGNKTDSIRRSLATKDPLAGLLFDRWRLTPARAALIGVGVEFLVKLLQVYHGLTARDSSLCWQFVNWGDWDLFTINMLLSFGVSPGVWAFYAWMATAPPNLLADLDNQRLFAPSQKDVLLEVTENGRRFLRSPWWPIASALVPVVAGVLWLHSYGKGYGSYLHYQLISWSFTWFMIGMIVVREVGLIRILHRYFATPGLQLRPLHPDRCGGLGPLNRYALTFTYFLAFAACGLALLFLRSEHQHDITNEYTLYAGIILYVALAPYFFFATLGTAHRSMQHAKNGLLQAISDQFLIDYHAARRVINQGPGKLRDEMEKIKQLHTIYRTTLRFPVWPFDWGHIRWFATAVLAPIGGVLVSQFSVIVPLLHDLLNGTPSSTSSSRTPGAQVDTTKVEPEGTVAACAYLRPKVRQQ